MFSRKVNEVRHKMGQNLNEAEALDMVKNASKAGAPNPFAASIPMAEQEMTDDQIDHKAFFDFQTPTYNFRYMLRAFKRELTRARRYKRSLSVSVVIVDGLMEILNQYGHLALESAIQESAATLIRCCRADVDMVGRYGEDRFFLLLPETPGTGAAVLAERIRKKFNQIEIPHQWYKLKFTASIGISYYPGHGGDVEELIAQADLAAEVVQERGGNGVCYAPESSEENAV
ncbi:MAG TPA: GGDEF domain-containing protein [Trichormus sp.]|jgi:diguanylate cyclase (GGDEF)-like protein